MSEWISTFSCNTLGNVYYCNIYTIINTFSGSIGGWGSASGIRFILSGSSGVGLSALAKKMFSIIINKNQKQQSKVNESVGGGIR